MTLKPKLSICVPSRNRQIYFQKTIESLLRNMRLDVEFVFADNSDDPSIMNAFMTDIVGDPRVIYLPSTGQTLSMVDNWERSIVATSGEWVVFIGDDDYVDPNVAQFITRLEPVYPNLDAVSWGVLHYLWPDADQPMSNIAVPFNSTVVKVPRAHTVSRMFGWNGSTTVPTSGFSIYHSAISRRLLDKIKKVYHGERYFEHPVVDYDNALKVISLGENFIFCQRSFGIMGVCPLSNSFSIGRLEDMKKKVAKFTEDLGRDMDDDDLVADFPFKAIMGVTATIGLTQHWFKAKYKLKYTGWEKNFVEACARNVETFVDPEAFEIVAEAYRRAIASWEGGKFLRDFNPKWTDPQTVYRTSGAAEKCLYLDYEIAGINTPSGLYDIVNDLSMPIDLIDLAAAAVKTVPVRAKQKHRPGARR